MAGLPLGVSDGELCASSKVRGCGSATLDAAGVFTLEGVEPNAEHFVSARGGGGWDGSILGPSVSCEDQT